MANLSELDVQRLTIKQDKKIVDGIEFSYRTCDMIYFDILHPQNHLSNQCNIANQSAVDQLLNKSKKKGLALAKLTFTHFFHIISFFSSCIEHHFYNETFYKNCSETLKL